VSRFRSLALSTKSCNVVSSGVNDVISTTLGWGSQVRP
jgi:hypothetical protein